MVLVELGGWGGGDYLVFGGIVVVVRMVKTVIRMAVVIRNNHFFFFLDDGVCVVGKIENWLGPQQNWLQSAFSKMPQKSRIDAYFQLLIQIILFFMHLLLRFWAYRHFWLAASIYSD